MAAHDGRHGTATTAVNMAAHDGRHGTAGGVDRARRRGENPSMTTAFPTPAPAKLIVGMLSGRRELLGEAGERLSRDHGPVDLRSRVWDFDFTDYYQRQMGTGLLRQFISFERLVPPEAIAAVKQGTNGIEAEFAAAGAGGPPRPVNLDCGYVTEGKLVLASTKDFAHRIYLGGGIFAEVTLEYAGGAWRAGPHTFPDYASGLYDEFLTAARSRLAAQLRRKEGGR